MASVTRPVKELKGFQKVELNPGQTREVTFKLTSDDLAFYTRNGKWEAEPGQFKIWVGTNSQEAKEGEFTLQ